MKNITLIVTLALLLCGCSKEKTNGIEARTVTNTDFADPLLYIYMQNKYDTNKDYIFQPEEVMAVTSLDLSKKNNFESLKGLELFVNVEVLNLAGQRPTDKNLKLTNPKLWSLNCSDMALRSLDVTGLSELTELDCSKSGIVHLDLSKNKKLREFICIDGADRFELDFSYNTEIEKVDIKKTKLASINLDNCRKLQFLNCDETGISSINISSCVDLKYLDLSGNNDLTSLDLKNCEALKTLYIRGIRLETLNISKNRDLEYLSFSTYEVFSLDIANNLKLKEIELLYGKVIIYLNQGQEKPQIITQTSASYEFQYR